MEFSRQEYWSGLPSPSPGDLPDPEIKPRSPALPAGSLTSELPGTPQSVCSSRQNSGFLYIWVLYLRFASDRRRDTFLLPWWAGQAEEDKMGADWCLFFSHVLGRWVCSCWMVSNLSMNSLARYQPKRGRKKVRRTWRRLMIDVGASWAMVLWRHRHIPSLWTIMLMADLGCQSFLKVWCHHRATLGHCTQLTQARLSC